MCPALENVNLTSGAISVVESQSTSTTCFMHIRMSSMSGCSLSFGSTNLEVVRL